jgi:hypothetical protein
MKASRGLVLFVAAAVGTLLAHCGGTSDGGGGASSDAGPAPDAALGPTFHKDVEPIVQKHCTMCHTEGGIGPFSMQTYAAAKDYASAMASRTKDRTMPPWGAEETASCKPTHAFREDNRLSPAEIATLEAWSRAGAPEGDPKDAPAKVVRDISSLPAKTDTLELSAYTMSSPTDVMRCFVVDPKLTATRYLNGYHVVPGALGVVHHALIYADPKRESLKKVQGGGDQYDCFGGPQFDSANLVGGWVPGSVPGELPPNVGTQMDAGTLFVVQVHYHAGGPGPREDKTKIELRFTDQKPEYYAKTRLIGNFRGAFGTTPGDGLQPGADGKVEFMIPPGAEGHEEVMRVTMPPALAAAGTVYLYGVGGHMHYIGVSEELRIKHVAPQNGAPADECLLGIPRWDFDWQRGFAYAAPIEQLPQVAAGDQITVKCGYNNSMSNPKMARVMRETGITAPQPVTLGESTLDEMCLGAFVFLAKVPF